jgi:hypothetical protein
MRWVADRWVVPAMPVAAPGSIGWVPARHAEVERALRDAAHDRDRRAHIGLHEVDAHGLGLGDLGVGHFRRAQAAREV